MISQSDYEENLIETSTKGNKGQREQNEQGKTSEAGIMTIPQIHRIKNSFKEIREKLFFNPGKLFFNLKAFFQPWKSFFQPRQSFFQPWKAFFSTLPNCFFHLAWFFSALRP